LGTACALGRGNRKSCFVTFGSSLTETTLGRADLPERIACAREPRKLPVVLGVEEVVRFLDAVTKKRRCLLPNYMNGGWNRSRGTDPELVWGLNFKVLELGKALPYGVYHIPANAGRVALGSTMALPPSRFEIRPFALYFEEDVSGPPFREITRMPPPHE
jgi:hypothetical protein